MASTADLEKILPADEVIILKRSGKVSEKSFFNLISLVQNRSP